MAPMRMNALQVYGIPSTVTEIWRQAVGEHLLPIQEEAVTTYSLFGGGNLLVSAPTSSGKTFVGELAAFHEAYKGGRVVYLVPLRAVAEEKYDEFRDRYKDYGVSVIISTGDHREYDEDLLSGNFHLAVVVFEKLLNLSVVNPGVLDYPTLVIVDECQMISDESRGGRLETLLTKIRKLPAAPRFIGLSAVAENTGGFDSWLNCELLAHKERPVELREGVVTNDFMFTYREWNTGANGSERLGDGSDKENITLTALCAQLLQQGDQILVFTDTPDATVSCLDDLIQGGVTAPRRYRGFGKSRIVGANRYTRTTLGIAGPRYGHAQRRYVAGGAVAGRTALQRRPHPACLCHQHSGNGGQSSGGGRDCRAAYSSP